MLNRYKRCLDSERLVPNIEGPDLTAFVSRVALKKGLFDRFVGRRGRGRLLGGIVLVVVGV